MDWTRIIDLAARAVALYQEGDELLAKVKEARASTKEALSTTDQQRLNELLVAAQERRRQASAVLDSLL